MYDLEKCGICKFSEIVLIMNDEQVSSNLKTRPALICLKKEEETIKTNSCKKWEYDEK